MSETTTKKEKPTWVILGERTIGFAILSGLCGGLHYDIGVYALQGVAIVFGALAVLFACGFLIEVKAWSDDRRQGR